MSFCLATGPYIEDILLKHLNYGHKEDLMNVTPKLDFGGGHPDPNLTYAATLVDAMGKGSHDIGAAFDGDGVRFSQYL